MIRHSGFLEAQLNATVDHSQWIDSNRRGGRLACDAAIANIERGAVPGAKQPKCPKAPTLEFRHRVRAFIFDSEEFAPGVTDENVVARHLERLAAPLGNICDIGQILKVAVSQRILHVGCSVQNSSIGSHVAAWFFVLTDAAILLTADHPEKKR